MTDPLTITPNQHQTEQFCQSPTALWSGEDYQTSTEAILQSIALVKQLLAEQPQLCQQDHSQLDIWAQRLLNSSSKILVTGDLNSGKSTLVNALLKTPDLLPVDQQPCTSMFCQVVNAPQQKDPLLHAFNDIHLYQPQDPTTYTVVPFHELYNLLTLEEPPFKVLRLYTDLTPYPSLIAHHQITLIDSPGLNTDSIRSTTEFAQEEEMDAVVFVVNAENHFTLSGRAFLQSITQPNVFIAVNKFDHIRDKERCKRLILEQIRDVSPLLYEQADQLVHFVSAAYGADATDFMQLEESLCRFVLQIRLESKLLPVQKSLVEYTRTLVTQAKQQADQTQSQLGQLESEFTLFLEDYARLVEAQHQVKHTFHPLIQQTVKETRQTLIRTLDSSSLYDVIQEVNYQGIHHIWSYAQTMSQVLNTHLNQRLIWMEQEANRQTETCRHQMHQLITEQVGHQYPWVSEKQQLKGSQERTEVDLQVQLSDLLCNKMDDKKLGLTTASLAILLLETETLQQQAVYWLTRLLKPVVAHSSHQYARRAIGWSLTCISLVSVGWTAYAFLSDMPGAVQMNLKHKFESAMERAQVQQRANTLTDQVQHLLEIEQTEWLCQLGQWISVKDKERARLEQNLFESKQKAHQLTTWLSRSNTILHDIENLPILSKA
ncbi:Transmembrane GTPase fzo1 [Choanephora cucurbitarum]|uniref:Transmembrane GTPase fzo1 n=1 Tax=Choanephora cucurbitarum TaxID=101091 RepID=A0A1C7NKU2_9FUNG|nr:Transmembrane GTPase fzo1 [Choanephora cucurbitarum]